MGRRTVFVILVGWVLTRVPPQALQEDGSRKISYRFNARLLSMTSIRGFSIKGKLVLLRKQLLTDTFHHVLYVYLETLRENHSKREKVLSCETVQ